MQIQVFSGHNSLFRRLAKLTRINQNGSLKHWSSSITYYKSQVPNVWKLAYSPKSADLHCNCKLSFCDTKNYKF